MREELDEIRLSNTTLLKEIDELHTCESQAREDIQRLRDENEKKEKQSLLLQFDLKHLRDVEKKFQKQTSLLKLADKSLKDLSQLRQSYKELKAMMEETLNVKLRYE